MVSKKIRSDRCAIETMKGFAKVSPIQPVCEHQAYTAELRRRYVTDDSELLIGMARILIPKHLSDPTHSAKKRKVWDCFATAASYHLLFLEESCNKGINQVFVFDNRLRLVQRVETNPWQEANTESGDVQEIRESNWQLIQLAAQHCKFDLDWLETPKAC